MAVSLTAAAAQRVKTMIEKRGSGIGLRLGIKKSGCTGFAYVVDYVDEPGSSDQVFTHYGVDVYVDAKSLPAIDGMEVDYVKESLLNEGFEFRNPNVKDECGCGESFSV
ncbi:iron-sulfur cluster assembly accessory protein [Thiomicrospira sp. ALE5]|uniref:HesB/IscA family protein n=1 Tax=Thiomicrospira sp. ALE5 TaxID=748650 RepID=UPI0008F3D81D|nr:iron-sulfur cluster assembly accessory protein [Thiomicrospira sp. ALE5]SFR63157.1 iron-sulfur cluster assembly protein [Thiomicrospira sp. ALE5]